MMKYFLKLLIFLNSYCCMEFSKYENLLEKHTSCIKEVLGDNFDNKLFGKYFYHIEDENISKKIYDINYNSVSILSNENEIIESVTIHFLQTIDRAFYDQLLQKYGLPKEIKVISKREVVSESNNNDLVFSQNMRKSNIELRNGLFEENPLYIIWKKDNFDIIIFTRHEQNMSELTFKSNK
jgi:hypothetical protein